jgi:hypothetical protein
MLQRICINTKENLVVVEIWYIKMSPKTKELQIARNLLALLYKLTCENEIFCSIQLDLQTQVAM